MNSQTEDTDDAQRSVEERRTNEARLRDFAEAGSDWFFEFDKQLRFSYVSDQLESLIGIKPQDLIGKRRSDFGESNLLPSEADLFNDNTARMMAREDWKDFTFTFVKDDGEHRILRTSGKAIFDSNGDFAGYRGVGSDVTDQVNLENRLRSLTEIINETVNEIYISDAETYQILEANPAARDNLGYSSSEMIKLKPWDFVQGLTRENIEELLEPLRDESKDRQIIEITHRRKDGTIFPVRTQLQYMESQTPPVFVAVVQDISKLTEAESKTKRFAQIVDNTVNEIIIVDANSFEVLHANKAAVNNLGYSLEELRGLPTREFVAELFDGKTEEPLAPIRSGEKDIVVCETIHRRKDGSTYPVEAQVQIMHDQNPPIMVLIIQDITQLKKARSHSDRFGAILDQSLNEIYVFDAGTMRFTQANFGARKNMGYSSEEFRQLTPIDIKPELSKDQFEEIIAPLRDGSRELIVFETVHQRKDGTTYPVEVHLQLMRSSAGDVFAAVIQDISERQRQTEALRLRDRAIFEVNTGVLITDATRNDNLVIYANRAMERMTGYSEDEILGRNPRFLQGDDRDQPALDRIRSAIRDAVPVRETLRNYRKDGSRFISDLTISPVRDEDGAVTHFIGVQTDITDKLETEERLRQSQKMEAIGQLTGGIAHDFNNLLTVVIGNQELLADRIADDELSASLLADASAAAENGAKLTGQLLTFARQMPLNSKSIDLNSLVEEMSDMLERTLGETIAIRMDLAADLGKPTADPAQVHNALLNLAINARDAMPDGGDLTIETTEMILNDPLVSESFGIEPGRFVRLCIIDTGSGMPPEVKARVVEPFFTTKEQGKGTGLGLSMVHGFAKQSGGHLEIDSELGHGTSISLYLPISREVAEERADTHVGAASETSGGETVLVVEDDPRVRNITSKRLKHLGYEVIEAEAGQQALDILAVSDDIDVVFTDMVMPGGMSGADLLVQVKQNYPHIRRLVASGYTEYGTMPNDGTLWLQKPYSIRELSQSFQELLE